MFHFNRSRTINRGGVSVIKTGTVVINPASINAGLVGATSVTITGALVGDRVTLIPPAALDAGLSYSCFVSAAGTVSLRIVNGTAGAVDVASGTWGYIVERLT